MNTSRAASWLRVRGRAAVGAAVAALALTQLLAGGSALFRSARAEDAPDAAAPIPPTMSAQPPPDPAAQAALEAAQYAQAARMEQLAKSACPEDMLLTRGFCVDRYESSMVDRDSGQPLSPFYPPHPKLLRRVFSTWEFLRTQSGDDAARRMPLPALSSWQKSHDFSPKALSLPGRVPQAYVSYHVAKRACQNAGKRLCSEEEWATACRGRWHTQYPYGNEFRRMSCNIYRYIHPSHVLHGLSSLHQLDPRFNLISVEGTPLLRDTGAMPNCKSPWWGGMAAHDMVGNLDEWVEDDAGTFRGGFYARATTKGCEAQVASHSPDYFDYSTGSRCCRDPLIAEAAAAP